MTAQKNTPLIEFDDSEEPEFNEEDLKKFFAERSLHDRVKYLDFIDSYQPIHHLNPYHHKFQRKRLQRRQQRSPHPTFNSETGGSYYAYYTDKQARKWRPNQDYSKIFPSLFQKTNTDMSDWATFYAEVTMNQTEKIMTDLVLPKGAMNEGRRYNEARARWYQNFIQSDAAFTHGQSRRIIFAEKYIKIQEKFGTDRAWGCTDYPRTPSKWLVTFFNPHLNSPINDINILGFITSHCHGSMFIETLNQSIVRGFNMIEVDALTDLQDNFRDIVPYFITFLRKYKIPFKLWPANVFQAVQPEAKYTWDDTWHALKKFPWDVIDKSLLLTEVQRVLNYYKARDTGTAADLDNCVSAEYKSHVTSLRRSYPHIPRPGEIRWGNHFGAEYKPNRCFTQVHESLLFLPILLAIIGMQITRSTMGVKFNTHIKDLPYFKPIWQELGKSPMQYSYGHCVEGEPRILFLDAAYTPKEKEYREIATLFNMHITRIIQEKAKNTSVREFFDHPEIRSKLGIILPDTKLKMYLITVVPKDEKGKKSKKGKNAIRWERVHNQGHIFNPQPHPMEYIKTRVTNNKLMSTFDRIYHPDDFEPGHPATILVIENPIASMAMKNFKFKSSTQKKLVDYFEDQQVYITRFPDTPVKDFPGACRRLIRKLQKKTNRTHHSINEFFTHHSIWQEFFPNQNIDPKTFTKFIGIKLYDRESRKLIKSLDPKHDPIEKLINAVLDKDVIVEIYDPYMIRLHHVFGQEIRTHTSIVGNIYKDRFAGIKEFQENGGQISNNLKFLKSSFTNSKKSPFTNDQIKYLNAVWTRQYFKIPSSPKKDSKTFHYPKGSKSDWESLGNFVFSDRWLHQKRKLAANLKGYLSARKKLRIRFPIQSWGQDFLEVFLKRFLFRFSDNIQGFVLSSDSTSFSFTNYKEESSFSEFNKSYKKVSEQLGTFLDTIDPWWTLICPFGRVEDKIAKFRYLTEKFLTSKPFNHVAGDIDNPSHISILKTGSTKGDMKFDHFYQDLFKPEHHRKLSLKDLTSKIKSTSISGPLEPSISLSDETYDLFDNYLTLARSFGIKAAFFRDPDTKISGEFDDDDVSTIEKFDADEQGVFKSNHPQVLGSKLEDSSLPWKTTSGSNSTIKKALKKSYSLLTIGELYESMAKWISEQVDDMCDHLGEISNTTSALWHNINLAFPYEFFNSLMAQLKTFATWIKAITVTFDLPGSNLPVQYIHFAAVMKALLSFEEQMEQIKSFLDLTDSIEPPHNYLSSFKEALRYRDNILAKKTLIKKIKTQYSQPLFTLKEGSKVKKDRSSTVPPPYYRTSRYQSHLRIIRMQRELSNVRLITTKLTNLASYWSKCLIVLQKTLDLERQKDLIVEVESILHDCKSQANKIQEWKFKIPQHLSGDESCSFFKEVNEFHSKVSFYIQIIQKLMKNLKITDQKFSDQIDRIDVTLKANKKSISTEGLTKTSESLLRECESKILMDFNNPDSFILHQFLKYIRIEHKIWKIINQFPTHALPIKKETPVQKWETNLDSLNLTSFTFPKKKEKSHPDTIKFQPLYTILKDHHKLNRCLGQILQIEQKGRSVIGPIIIDISQKRNGDILKKYIKTLKLTPDVVCQNYSQTLFYFKFTQNLMKEQSFKSNKSIQENQKNFQEQFRKVGKVPTEQRIALFDLYKVPSDIIFTDQNKRKEWQPVLRTYSEIKKLNSKVGEKIINHFITGKYKRLFLQSLPENADLEEIDESIELKRAEKTKFIKFMADYEQKAAILFKGRQKQSPFKQYAKIIQSQVDPDLEPFQSVAFSAQIHRKWDNFIKSAEKDAIFKLDNKGIDPDEFLKSPPLSTEKLPLDCSHVRPFRPYIIQHIKFQKGQGIYIPLFVRLRLYYLAEKKPPIKNSQLTQGYINWESDRKYSVKRKNFPKPIFEASDRENNMWKHRISDEFWVWEGQFPLIDRLEEYFLVIPLTYNNNSQKSIIITTKLSRLRSVSSLSPICMKLHRYFSHLLPTTHSEASLSKVYSVQESDTSIDQNFCILDESGRNAPLYPYLLDEMSNLLSNLAIQSNGTDVLSQSAFVLLEIYDDKNHDVFFDKFDKIMEKKSRDRSKQEINWLKNLSKIQNLFLTVEQIRKKLSISEDDFKAKIKISFTALFEIIRTKISQKISPEDYNFSSHLKLKCEKRKDLEVLAKLKTFCNQLLTLTSRGSQVKPLSLFSAFFGGMTLAILPNGNIRTSIPCISEKYYPSDQYQGEYTVGFDLGLRQFLWGDIKGPLGMDTTSISRQLGEKCDQLSQQIQHHFNRNKDLRDQVGTLRSILYRKIHGKSRKALTSLHNLSTTSEKSKQVTRSGAHNITHHILEIPNQMGHFTGTLPPIEFRIENLASIPVIKGDPFAWEKSQWITGQFEEYLSQKARMTGHKITTIPSYYTSKLCAQCYREGQKGYLVKVAGKVSQKSVNILLAPLKPEEIDQKIIDKFQLVSDLANDSWASTACQDSYTYQQGKIYPSQIHALARKLNNHESPVITFFPSEGGNILSCHHCLTVADRDRNAVKNIAQYNRIWFSLAIARLMYFRRNRTGHKTKWKGKFWKYLYRFRLYLSQIVSFIVAEGETQKQVSEAENKHISYLLPKGSQWVNRDSLHERIFTEFSVGFTQLPHSDQCNWWQLIGDVLTILTDFLPQETSKSKKNLEKLKKRNELREVAKNILKILKRTYNYEPDICNNERCLGENSKAIWLPSVEHYTIINILKPLIIPKNKTNSSKCKK